MCRYSVLSLVIGTLPLLFVPQAVDLLSWLLSRPAATPTFAFYATLALWGLAVWYTARALLDTVGHSIANRRMCRWLPRVFGALTIAAPVVPLVRVPGVPPLTKAAYIVGCVALLAAFLAFVVKRRALISTLPAFAAVTARHVAAVSLAVSLLLFAVLLVKPLDVAPALGAVALLFVVAANTVLFGSVAVYYTRTTRVPIELVAFAFAALFSLGDRNDNHTVRLLDGRPPERTPITTVFDQWVRTMPGASAVGAPAPVFLVAAEGGGIRAAYWTALVLASLDDAFPPGVFARHLFAVSGISGGSVGAGVYAALRYDGVDRDLAGRSRRILQRDFLSPVIAKMVTGDFLQWFLPFRVYPFDRSLALEDGFARAYDEVTGRDTLTRPFLDFHPDVARHIPVLLLNSTVVEEGRRLITASAGFDAAMFPETRDFHAVTGHDTSLVRALHNSARFTYVSPAGRIPDVGDGPLHLVDGGYFEPTGAETLLDLYTALSRSPAVRSGRASLIPIFISNTPVEHGRTPVELLGELFAPVKALYRTRGAHGASAAARLAALAGYTAFALCATTDQKQPPPSDQVTASRSTQSLPEPPLGWALSPSMAARLDDYWTTCQGNTDSREAIDRLLGGLSASR